MQRLAEGEGRSDRGDGGHGQQQRRERARRVAAQDADQGQQADDAHAPGQPGRAEHEPRRHVDVPAEDERRGVDDQRPDHRLRGDRHAGVGDGAPALLQHGRAREPEHADQRHGDPDADAGVAQLRRQADRHAGDADREPGPQARITALLAAADREARRDQRRQAQHGEGRERRRHAEGEAAVHATELDDLQQHADRGEPAQGRAAPASGAQRQRLGHERGQGEPQR